MFVWRLALVVHCCIIRSPYGPQNWWLAPPFKTLLPKQFILTVVNSINVKLRPMMKNPGPSNQHLLSLHLPLVIQRQECEMRSAPSQRHLISYNRPSKSALTRCSRTPSSPTCGSSSLTNLSVSGVLLEYYSLSSTECDSDQLAAYLRVTCSFAVFLASLAVTTLESLP